MQEMLETWVWSLGREYPLKEKIHPAPVFLPGESHRQRSLDTRQSLGSQRVGHDWTYTQACSEHWSACTTQSMFAVILFFLYICPGVGLLDHMVALVSVFKGIFLLFSIVAVPIYNSTKRKESFLCSTPSPAFIVYRLFDDHSDYTLL